jgi:hypothetical protein
MELEHDSFGNVVPGDLFELLRDKHGLAASVKLCSQIANFDSEHGAQAPFSFFDPLGLIADGDQAKFDHLRYVEIKHGRISMLAVAG